MVRLEVWIKAALEHAVETVEVGQKIGNIALASLEPLLMVLVRLVV